ncbi:amino acid deaminase [Ideonella sp. YS5]|uniref:amino acid deaminase n=1 Tax=Ideonella sp. YS5 TaxID=3453714 RepID=UPI003EEBCEBC
MDELLDPLLDGRFKGYPGTAPPLRRSLIGAQGWHLFDGRCPLPLAVIRREALVHNLAWMQRLVDEAGIGFAPHGKTTMSPQLFNQQLVAGAWGITFANVQQLALGVASGVRRAVIANQVLQASDLASLAALLQREPGLRAPFLVDSAEQIALIEQANMGVVFEVLVELGLPGGRTGVRDDEAALQLARRVRASPALKLAGIELYEGLWATGEDEADRALVEGLMGRLQRLVAGCETERLFEVPQPLVTAGGSAVFDFVADGLAGITGGTRLLALLRSGCYVTHDDGAYRRYVQTVNRRMGCSDASGLHAALEVWAVVQSCPEAGLAVLNAGKRDVSTDWGLPVALKVCPAGSREPQPAPASWVIDKLNDQHAYLRLNDGGVALHVGDRVALGISHPCTTFDKWRWMPVVDERYAIVDAITTAF